MRRAGPHHRQALVDAVRQVTGLDTTTEGIPVHGMLDPDILTSVSYTHLRIFRVKERVSLEFRAEAFNLMNHVNPGDSANTGTLPGGVDVTLTDANFGKIVSALDPRIMQVAMKVVF